MNEIVNYMVIGVSAIACIISIINLVKISKLNAKINNQQPIRQQNQSIIKYDEDEIIAHLDYLVKEVANFYTLTKLIPGNIPYINTKIEKEFIEFLQDRVSERISPVLLSQLEFIYNSESVSKYIGEYIYFFATKYIVDYNMNNDKKIKGME